MITNSECDIKISKAKEEWYPIAGIVIGVWYFFIRKKKESDSKYTKPLSDDKYFRQIGK